MLKLKRFQFTLGIQFFSESYGLGVANIMLDFCFHTSLRLLKVGGVDSLEVPWPGVHRSPVLYL